jgi:hypothetical protein
MGHEFLEMAELLKMTAFCDHTFGSLHPLHGD